MKVTPQDSDGMQVQLDRDEYTEIIINNIMIVIKHNDVGISIDTYDRTNPKEPKHKYEEQIWFDDFDVSFPLVMFYLVF